MARDPKLEAELAKIDAEARAAEARRVQADLERIKRLAEIEAKMQQRKG